MEQTTSSHRHLSAAPDMIERSVDRRASLRNKHVHSLTQLMAERADLRGVNEFADFVDDSVRWSA